jgi:alginate O-acetyltransferase complex protein AlgI
MVFSSITFLFFFLPAVLLAVSAAGRKAGNICLLSFSLFFYAWGEGVYVLLMLLSIAANYIGGRLIHRLEGQVRRLAFVSTVSLNLLLLGYFKYAGFIADSLSRLLAYVGIPPLQFEPVHLPIGISFFTFQALSYIIDIYRRKTLPQESLVNLALYISLFPQLIAGPIVRYTDISAQLSGRKTGLEQFCRGVQRFIYGLSKKVLLANPLAEIADRIFALPGSELTVGFAWLGALCYTLQIYYDFSGYSDMAIGLGRMFGFSFLENFNYPYVSRSIREFWRRWHISLSSWLRDYVYIPLGGNRGGTGRTYFNLLLVFFLCGLWHGASWTFVVWGFYHGFFLVLERTAPGKTLERLWRPLQRVVTLLIIVFGWVIFRCETLGEAGRYLVAMLGRGGEAALEISFLFSLDRKQQTELVAAIVLAAPVYPGFVAIRGRLLELDSRILRYSAELSSSGLQFFLSLVLLYFSIISLAAGAYNPFIYFRF